MITQEDAAQLKKDMMAELVKFKREGLEEKGKVKLLLGQKEREIINSELFDTLSEINLTDEERKEIFENPKYYSIELIYTTENNLLQGCLVL